MIYSLTVELVSSNIYIYFLIAYRSFLWLSIVVNTGFHSFLNLYKYVNILREKSKVSHDIVNVNSKIQAMVGFFLHILFPFKMFGRRLNTP